MKISSGWAAFLFTVTMVAAGGFAQYGSLMTRLDNMSKQNEAFIEELRKMKEEMRDFDRRLFRHESTSKTMVVM